MLPGEEWAQAIDDRLQSGDLVLLLVSADFIESNYCFGLEMTTALAQDQAGRSRVVPIIVRRCDWETARFGKLQAVPRDNVPVATHPRGADEALTEVAKELRRLAAEIVDARSFEATIPTKDGLAVAGEQRRSWWSRRRRMLLGGAGAVAAIAAVALSVAFTLSSSMVSEGRRDLRVGAYDTARKQFERATAINPFDWHARRGLRLARLGLMIPTLANKADDFSRELEGLERGQPHDPQLMLFRGDLALDDYRRAGEPPKLDAAGEAYRAAIERDPAFSEARARLPMFIAYSKTCRRRSDSFARPARTARNPQRARPRDLYDVINLFRHDEFHPAPAVIHDVLRKKCEFKSIALPTVARLSDLREELEGIGR